MAYELVEEVLDHAPAFLDTAEMLLLTVIAEQARKRSRSADIPRDLLLRRLRMGEPGLRKVFKRLEKHGIEVRVPLRVRPDGVPVFAMIGHVCSFKLPDFAAPENCPCHRCKEAIPQALLRKEERPQLPETEPQLPETEPQLPETEPQAPPTGPVPPPGAHRTVGENRRAIRGAPTVHPKADLISSMRLTALDASRKKRAAANGSHPPAFEALMKYQVDTDSGGEPDAQAPEL